MIRFSLRALAVATAIAGASSFSFTAANAAEPPAPTAGNPPSAVASASDVAAVSPANLAGLLNYCIMTDHISHEDGDALQTAVNEKTNAVPTDQRGNMDYAVGSTGQFEINGQRSTITSLESDAQGRVCGAVLTRAKTIQ
ncbi:hypothetical protein AA0472_1192 [Acetobacter estunensis NRIC 0472]|uniref:Alcohol dehydrogenase n=1 Tax=Acetobacter estunensis TaxID=104097 RepID=A0A967ECG3_9PROT|nr:alcohol dehydrogenase [Acetobacter estunensis]NHO53241.1 alcohol dehydrogenase [Acetobacter estunensis]GBQ23715.1 hypothetical protein AA0472_1192 [Acetobacter estunensis NRIC 0472]